MKFPLLILLLISSNSFLNAQGDKEFEGIIKYNHKYRFDSKNQDTVGIKNELGTSSVFYYKNGNYKWVMAAIPGFTEYFDAKTQTAYSINENSDTILQSYLGGYDDSLLVFNKIEKPLVICGKTCNGVETITFTKGDPSMWCRRVLYYSDAVSLGNDAFRSYRTYASNKVYKQIKCWPLRIELEGPLMPKLVIEAVEIIPKQLSNSEVNLPSNKPIKAWQPRNI